MSVHDRPEYAVAAFERSVTYQGALQSVCFVRSGRKPSHFGHKGTCSREARRNVSSRMLDMRDKQLIPVSPVLAHREADVIRRYAERRGLSDSVAELHWVELMKFLALCVEGDRSFVPAPAVDEIWHDFIVHTILYRRFCDDVLGSFVDHVPTEGLDSCGYEATVDAIERAFGKPDPMIWSKAAGAACVGKNCSSCRACRSR